MKMKLMILCLLTIVLCPLARAQGTTFIYQGRLNDGANPASGSYDLQFTVFATSSGGSGIAGPLTQTASAVSNGLFTVTLDFGAGVFTGADRWLEIGVRTNGGGAFTTLTPRQPITPTPYALHAKSVSASGISGALPSASLTGTYSNPLTFLNGANSFSGSFYGQFFGTSFTGGSFSGDGSGLLNLNASQILAGTFPAATLGNAWRIVGNSGTSETNFIGTTENHALDFRVANSRGFRIEPDPRIASDSANIIGGNPANRIERPDSGGNVVAGGGFAGGPNIIRSNSSGVFIGSGSANEVGPNANDVVLAGGFGNSVKTYGATISGGRANLIQANSDYASISGGLENGIRSNSAFSVIGGGVQNVLRAEGATIGGGLGNTNFGYAATVAGGFFNTASNNGAFVGGGGLNRATGFNSVVAGGDGNVASAQSAAIGGGYQNRSSGFAAIVGGGYANRATNFYATVPGGILNVAGGAISFAAGLQAHALHAGAFVWNDSTGVDFFSITNDEFAVRASNGVRFVTSGAGITLNGKPVLTADATNALTLNNPANTINGTFSGNGAGLTNLNAWQLGGNAGTGGANFLGTTDNQPLEIKVNGARALRIEPNVAVPNLIGGSLSNQVINGAVGATIAGGGSSAAGDANVVGGNLGTIGGGRGNLVSVAESVVAGGRNNAASAFNATVSGGFANTASGDYASVPGGLQNTAAAASSLAAGRQAKANHAGTFVWADNQAVDFASSGANQFLVRASGGVGINTNNPTAALHVGGIPGTDGIRFPNGTLQTTAPVPVFASGPGLNPTTTNQFLAQTVTVTVNSSAQKILVTSHKALGSTAVAGANNLSLYIGVRPAGTSVSPNTVGGGALGNRVAQNTRITMGLSGMITGLAPGDYEVGLMGSSSDAVNWNSNEFSYTTATVY